MRTIKFRAWDKRIRKWLWYNFEKYTSESHTDRPTEERIGTFWLTPYWTENKDDIEWVQFTGLLDKNGKEIYESDIVKVYGSISTDDPVYGFYEPEFEVKWEQETCSWILSEHGGRLVSSGEYEVIGNIYENPELL